MESLNLLINILLKQFKLYARSYKDKASLVKNIPQRTEAIAMDSHTFFFYNLPYILLDMLLVEEEGLVLNIPYPHHHYLEEQTRTQHY